MAMVEKLVSAYPQYPSLLVDHGSLRKRQESLEKSFAQEAALNFIDVCNYGIIPAGEDRYPLLALSKILSDFQELVTVVFDAIRVGKAKIRSRPSAENVQLSSFDFGYAAAGSLRIALTIPNERLLVGGSDLDSAISAIFGLMQASDSGAVSKFAEFIGIAAVKKLYELADEHRKYDLNADVVWGRDSEIRNHVTVHSPQFERLCDIIKEKSEVTTDALTLAGRLAGLDVDLGTFHMTFPEGADISGRLAEDFVRDSAVRVPGNYTATLVKSTVIYYSTQQDKVTFVLERLI
jgi:hypothetical protein